MQCWGRTSAGSFRRNPFWQVPLGWCADLHTYELQSTSRRSRLVIVQTAQTAQIIWTQKAQIWTKTAQTAQRHSRFHSVVLPPFLLVWGIGQAFGVLPVVPPSRGPVNRPPCMEDMTGAGSLFLPANGSKGPVQGAVVPKTNRRAE